MTDLAKQIREVLKSGAHIDHDPNCHLDADQGFYVYNGQNLVIGRCKFKQWNGQACFWISTVDSMDVRLELVFMPWHKNFKLNSPDVVIYTGELA